MGAVCASSEVFAEEQSFSTWEVTGTATLPGDFDLDGYEAIRIGTGATLRVEDGIWPSFHCVTVETGGTLEVLAPDNYWEEDEAGNAGVLVLDKESRVLVDAGGILTSDTLVSAGGTLTVTGTARHDAAEDAQQNVLSVSTLRLKDGITHLRVGGADRFGIAEDAALPFGRGRVGFETLEMEGDARLVVEIGNGGRVHWGADSWNANSDGYAAFKHPDAGTLMIAGSATITPNMYWTVGETSKSAWERGQNLLVVRDGVVELNGVDMRLYFAPGTQVTFEPGAVLWITTESQSGATNSTIAEAGILEQINFSNASVSGLGNLTIRWGEEGQEMYFTVNAAGQVLYQLRPPVFEGRFRPMLEALWAKRREAPVFYRDFFVRTTSATAGNHLALMASATTVNGTRERMAAAGVMRSMAVSNLLRSMEWQGRKVVEKAKRERRLMPEILRDVPLFLDISSGSGQVRAKAPAVGLERRAHSDETSVRAGFALGKGDWRFGLEGLFMDTDFREGRSGSTFTLTRGSSEMAGVTLFSRYQEKATEWILDASWLEATDKVGVPMLGDVATVDDTKRTLWSVGTFLNQGILGSATDDEDWRLTVFGGLRAWWWRDADAVWKAKGGEVLRTHEKGGFGVTGTLGAGIEGGQKLAFAGAPSLLSDFLPTRVDGALRTALQAGHFPGGHMTVAMPTVTDVTVDMPIEKLSNVRGSADLTLGLQFPSTRVEFSATTLSAGRRYRSQTFSARLLWRY